jgi:hypothetical protein
MQVSAQGSIVYGKMAIAWCTVAYATEEYHSYASLEETGS